MKPHHLSVLALVLSIACGDSNTPNEGARAYCDCALGGTTVLVSDSMSATAVRVSGNGCDQSDLVCDNQSAFEGSLCADGAYFIEANRAGACHIEVDLVDHGTFARDVTFEENDGCCAGFYPVTGDAIVNVTGP